MSLLPVKRDPEESLYTTTLFAKLMMLQTQMLQLENPDYMYGVVFIITSIVMSKVCDDNIEDILKQAVNHLKDNGWQQGLEEAYGKLDE